MATDAGGKGIVFLHNDDVTPIDFVVIVLHLIFGLFWPEAFSLTVTAHLDGIALVGIYPFEEAKYKVGEAHALARSAGYPLTLTIEAENPE